MTMPTLPDVLPCLVCGHNLARSVNVVTHGATTTQYYQRAYWGTLEREGDADVAKGQRTIACPECDTAATAEQAAILGVGL